MALLDSYHVYSLTILAQCTLWEGSRHSCRSTADCQLPGFIEEGWYVKESYHDAISVHVWLVSFYDLDDNNAGSLTANLIGRPEKVKGFATMTLGAMLQCISCCVGGAILAHAAQPTSKPATTSSPHALSMNTREASYERHPQAYQQNSFLAQ